MGKRELVDAEGYISDDSSFYGDDDTKKQYEEIDKGRLKCERGYYPPVAVPPYKKLKQPFEPLLQDHPVVKCESGSGSQLAPKSETKHSQSILSTLKSRPQLASLEKTHAIDVEPVKLEQPRMLNGKQANDPVSIDNFKDHPAAWQQSEKIEDFLHRLPVKDPATAQVGHWLWVGRPTIPYAHSKRKETEEIEAFKDAGGELLESLQLQRAKVESDNSGKSVATITRKMNPYRDQLESDLLSLAVKMGRTCGKWMLRPDPSDLPRVWRIVATATADGKLGPTSKVGTLDPSDPKPLICIYTYDFSDFDDVRRVLEEMVDLALCHPNGKPVYYKCDAYTYLEIMSSNPYKLRASLYSSKEILNNEVKALANGPVARMKKNSKTMAHFPQMFKHDDIS